MGYAGVHEQVARAARSLYDRTDELAVVVARAIATDVDLYHSSVPVPFELVVAGCAANMRPVFSAMATDDEFDTSAATALGIERARDDVPLAAIMEAYRVGFHQLWGAMIEESTTDAHPCNQVIHLLTGKVLTAQDAFTSSMARGYRDEQTRRILRDATERSALIDSLLHGRLFEQWSLWEAADYLRLPSTGPYVVVTAEASAVGDDVLPQIESKLRSLDVFSAWRLLPDVHVGIVHFTTEEQLDNALSLVSRLTTSRIGVSAPFDDLRETAQALRYARITMRGRPDAGEHVSRFDGSILATAAVSAPEVLAKLVAPTLDSFAELGEDERQVLFETFRVWVENGGSLRATGELLFCHPNTVRYRLRRIEERTGRTLAHPQDTAELCLAFEVNRRLLATDAGRAVPR